MSDGVPSNVYDTPRTATLAYGQRAIGLSDRDNLRLAARHGSRNGACLDAETVSRVCEDYEKVFQDMVDAEQRAMIATQALKAQQGQGEQLLSLLGDARALNRDLLRDLDAMRDEVQELRGRNMELICTLADVAGSEYRALTERMDAALAEARRKA